MSLRNSNYLRDNYYISLGNICLLQAKVYRELIIHDLLDQTIPSTVPKYM